MDKDIKTLDGGTITIDDRHEHWETPPSQWRSDLTTITLRPKFSFGQQFLKLTPDQLRELQTVIERRLADLRPMERGRGLFRRLLGTTFRGSLRGGTRVGV